MLSFRTAYALLDHDLAIELRRFVDRRSKFFLRARLRDSDRRSEVRRLHKHWILQLAVYILLRLLRVRVPVAAQKGNVLHDGEPSGAKQRLHNVLVHTRGRAQHACTHVRNVGQFEQPLNGSVLPEGSMQHGKNYVHINGTIGGAPRERAGIRLKRSERPGGTMRRFRRNDHSFSSRKHRRARRSIGIARAQMLLFVMLTREQPFGIARGQPSPVLGNADRNNFIFALVDSMDHRSGREQRHLVLSASPAKQNPNSQFLHDVFSVEACPSPRQTSNDDFLDFGKTMVNDLRDRCGD